MTGTDTWSEHRYRVRSNELVTPVIREMWLTPVDAALTYRAGQYVLLCDGDWHVPQRSYSVASAPRADGAICLLVTLVPEGRTSAWAHDLRADDEVLLEGPYGMLVAQPGRTAPALLLGAGSGLAPVRALAEAMLAEEPGRSVTLFFSCRTAADLIGDAELARWQAEHPRFRYLHTLTRERTAPRHGRIPAQLADAVGELAGWEVFAAGPSGFVVGCAAAAHALGAATTDIHTEEFFSDPQPWLGTAPEAPSGPDSTGETT
ncbi:MAG TPA: FAD-binding oxidoreductase [Ottowia sp.]|uniref:ferredoxin--NADP reductase n=1 Tax=Ottowia sp. TaxID=1898956 RepID=UPI002C618CF4|nr:FAD-binding oxidoreductase [Ottowia sp.]HMN21182.1 FAD-binding oxidoreductase [Ottowia sp.]